MRKLVFVGVTALALGCAARPEAVAPVALPTPPLVHRVEWSGQTLEQIANWYTGKSANWEKLTKPVNPDLERCCVPLRVGREVSIPSEILTRVEPMPKTKVTTKAKVVAKASAKAETKAETKTETKAEPEAAVATPAEAVSEAPAAASSAKRGKVSFKGESWTVADALAYPGDDGAVAVVLSSKPFDRKEFAKDGKIDTFDVMRHNGMNSASSLTLKIGEDGSLGCVDFATQSGGGSSCSSVISEGFKLESMSKDAIAGRLAFESDEDKADVKFDVPVTTKVERGGQALPEGGGEPGKAVLANFAAIHAGNYDEAKALSHPEKRKMMEESEAESKEMFELMKAITPSDVKVRGGRIDGDTAVVDFEGKSDGQPVKGTVDVQRFEGKWYVESVNTSQ